MPFNPEKQFVHFRGKTAVELGSTIPVGRNKDKVKVVSITDKNLIEVCFSWGITNCPTCPVENCPVRKLKTYL